MGAVAVGSLLSLSGAAAVHVATVHITGNFNSDEDILLFADTTTISGSFNSVTGVLTLTGTGDVVPHLE